MLTAESVARAMHTLARTEDADSVVTKTVAFLKEKGALTLLPRVATHVARLQASASSGERIVVASKADAKQALHAAQELGLTNTTAVIEDASLIGGYIVTKKGTQIDASYKSALLSVYRSVVRGN